MNPASEQFHQRAAAFNRANPGMIYVVRKGQDDESVRAWFTYFNSRGQVGTIDLFYKLLNEKHPIQFPCRLPEHFEPGYEAPRNQWRDPSSGEIVSRGDVSAVVESTMASLRAARPRGRQPVPPEHLKPPEKTPQQWLNEYQANPPPVPVFSDEFKARLAKRDRFEAAE